MKFFRRGYRPGDLGADLMAGVADGMTGDRHDSNTELIAQGVANIVCPFFCGLPAAGAITRPSANVTNGARSPISGIIRSGTLLLSGLHRQPLDMLRRAGFVEVIGRKNLCAHFDDALARAREILKS
ncbi:MAG: SulP family inorganic anion transporter [Terrimicrobiaceae bacterium]|jgi:MFS superfamily sulfate permease-like transporter|nr:SulP family inorganic anion transporter [Terrimicrobiaceae bacterium]